MSLSELAPIDEAKARGVVPASYAAASRAGASHEEILNAFDNQVQICWYTRAITCKVSHDEAIEASKIFRNTANHLAYVWALEAGLSHSIIMSDLKNYDLSKCADLARHSLSSSEIKNFIDMNCDYEVFALLIENEYSKEQAIIRSTPNDVKVVLNEPN